MAGFKSFVDPTTFYAPGNLTGVVGPNGCGKSNIIDAVRWVMGEGSAKVLRGDSMVDVIFSGSRGRKPVGTATVELLFDNADGRVSGQFAGYSEISLKRQVSRDGVSVYFLNGSRCRRKDVRDLLLGTGLGSRSYSIIEQGMISEVVDAKPEEIRGHLEEAAGISKYKERRRETERRIQHTRNNLSRLSDLREEVGKHLAKLKRQANAANRYRELKQHRRELESNLMTLRWQKLMLIAESGKQGLAGGETRLQESIARQRSAEAALEKLHQDQGLASEAFSQVQGELYSVGAEIARLEQSIEHARELQKRQQKEFDETGNALKDLEKHMVLDKAQVQELTQALADVEPALKKATAIESSSEEQSKAAELAVQSWQKQFEEHHIESTRRTREADRCRSEIEVLDEKLLQAARRLKALGQESVSMDASGIQQAMEDLEKQSAELKLQEQQQKTSLENSRNELSARQAAFREKEDETRTIQRQLHTCEGRLESLQALQKAALENKTGEDWLRSKGLSQASRLAKTINVTEGWEMAVEAVLGHWLESVVTGPDADHGAALAELEGVSLSLIEDTQGAIKARSGSLGAQVKAPDAIISWLNKVQAVDTLDQAWSKREQLEEGESCITPSGEWLGKGWVRVAKGQSEQDSMLAREKVIHRLQDEISELSTKAKSLSDETAALRTTIEQSEAGIIAAQNEFNALHRKRNEVDGQLESRQSSLVLMDKRQENISSEVQLLQQQIKQDESRVSTARASLEQLVNQMAALNEHREGLDEQRSALMTERDSKRNALGEARNARHELALKAESRRASLESLRQSLERMDTQISQLQQRYINLSEQIAQAEEPENMHAAEMEALLKQRLETEARLGEARQSVQQLEIDYREKDKDRQKAIQNSDEMRQELEQARLQQQEIELNARTIQRQVEQMDADVHELVEHLPENVDIESWEADLERLQIRITRLEPVNLAAIQEFDEEKKRKDYLDKQNEDLCDALQTLENAIAKIDRKTRTRFKDTFERVNKGIQELFPRLFGGGHAYLELTGEDLLTTGVTIMAQPPGKRVSNLNLL
jgi:chromosome segregation protein